MAYLAATANAVRERERERRATGIVLKSSEVMRAFGVSLVPSSFRGEQRMKWGTPTVGKKLDKTS